MKILLIKLGAKGDCLRTTAVLRGLHEKYLNPQITWVTERSCLPLLEDNELIHRLITIDSIALPSEVGGPFNLSINLDETNKAILLMNLVQSEKKLGYGMDADRKFYPLNQGSVYAYNLTKDDDLKFKQNTKSYVQIIHEMCELEWKGAEYDLSYSPKTRQIDNVVALCTNVGPKWPTKAWKQFDELEMLLENHGLQTTKWNARHDLYELMDWINECEYVISPDTLTMHLAIAMRKKVIAIFTSTCASEIDLYQRGIKLVPAVKCSPCYQPICPHNLECQISPKLVLGALLEIRGISHENG